LFSGQSHPRASLQFYQRSPAVDDLVLELDDLEGTPLGSPPSASDQPGLDFLDEVDQVLFVGVHDEVELGELPGLEEDLAGPELEVRVVQPQGLEESPAEQLGVQALQRLGEVVLVHLVDL